jgi:hypothetical protein
MNADRFLYESYELDAERRRVVCRYSLGARRFTEEIGFEPSVERGSEERGAWYAAWDSAPVDAAARILFLLAGVSYYKTGAPPLIDLGTTETTEEERAFLRTFYIEGLGEFAYRNGIDLSEIDVHGPDLRARRVAQVPLAEGRPLVPFGAGIDSIVTATHVARRHPGASLFVVGRGGDRFAAIEDAAAMTGLPIVRANRWIDPSMLRSGELGFLNGHVPVTGILSAIAVVAAVLGGHDAVVMSNERSASVPTVRDGDRAVNHQWSKSASFESAFRGLIGRSLTPPPEYFSYLRACSELWVAQEFAELGRYLPVFRSCNRAFATDPARRLDRWCGTCDKCCFVDIVLAPFVPAAELSGIFDGREPLGNRELGWRFRALIGTGGGPKPFECVGDEQECRAAVILAAARADRTSTTQLQSLAAEVGAAAPAWRDREARDAMVQGLLVADASDFVPPRYRDPAHAPGTHGGRVAGERTEPRRAVAPSSP